MASPVFVSKHQQILGYKVPVFTESTPRLIQSNYTNILLYRIYHRNVLMEDFGTFKDKLGFFTALAHLADSV